MNLRLYRLLLDPQGGEGGDTTGTVVAKGDDTATSPEGDAAKAAETLKGLISKHGDANSVALVLLQENYGLRSKNSTLKARVTPDGATVLVGDEAANWTAYKALGKPADLTTALSDRDKFKGEADGFRREKLIGDVAGLYGYKPSVLTTLAKDLAIEIAEAQENGKAVKRAVVKGEGDKVTPLDKFAEAHWADFLPSLKAGAAAPPAGSPNRGNPPRVTIPMLDRQDDRKPRANLAPL